MYNLTENMCLQGKSKEFIADVYIIWWKLEIIVTIKWEKKQKQKQTKTIQQERKK